MALCALIVPEVRRVEESDGSTERLHELENGESRRGLFFEDAAKYGGDLEDFQGIKNILKQLNHVISNPLVC